MVKTIFFTALVLVFCGSVFAQKATSAQSSAASTTASSSRFFPLADVREGLRGTARTVFRGSEPEEFNVEILGVVPGGIGPKQDMIIGRISGGSADRTSVFAGMSGSPVYVDGKLLGAISYSFPFSKEAICGITPIDQMIGIFERAEPARAGNREPKVVSFAELASTNWKPEFLGGGRFRATLSGVSAGSKLAPYAGQMFQPIALPLSFSGIEPEVLNMFAPQLTAAGLLPVSGISGAATMSPLKPADDKTLLGGASVSMQLTRGDYSLAAAGTVTFRDGEKIYAFGHPFLSLGVSDLPMSESHVVTVIPNMNNSFKMAVPDAMVGAMTQDRATGVFGKLGQAPKMIPVELNMQTSRGQRQTMRYEVAKDEFLTPLLLNITLFNSLVANERGIGDATVRLDGEVTLKNQPALKIDGRFGGGQAPMMASMSVAMPVNVLLKSDFDAVEITKITLTATSTDGNKSAFLDRLTVDKNRVRPGETIEIQAFARTDSGAVFVQRIPLTIPADAPAGQFSVFIGDGNATQQNSVIQQFVPKNLTELINVVNSTKKSDRLYAQLVRTVNGSLVGINEMPNLPPSMLATMNSDRATGGFKPTTQTIMLEQPIAPAEFIIIGSQSLPIEVVR